MSKEDESDFSSLYCPYEDILPFLKNHTDVEIRSLVPLWYLVGPQIFYDRDTLAEKEMVNAIYTDLFGKYLLNKLCELKIEYSYILLHSRFSFSLAEQGRFFEDKIVLPAKAPIILIPEDSIYFGIIPLDNRVLCTSILHLYLFTFLNKNF